MSVAQHGSMRSIHYRIRDGGHRDYVALCSYPPISPVVDVILPEVDDAALSQIATAAEMITCHEFGLAITSQSRRVMVDTTVNCSMHLVKSWSSC